MNSLRKPTDGLVSRYLNRPISLAITRCITNTGIRPNHVTVVTLILGLLGGWVLSLGGYAAGVGGTLLLQIQSILDGVDGELARLKDQGSRLGQWLDTVSDDLGELSFLVGATVATAVPWLRWFGLVGVVTYVAMKVVLYTLLAKVLHTGDLQAFTWQTGRESSAVSRLKFLFKHDFFCLLTVALALVGQIDIALFLGSAGAIVVFAKLVGQLSRTGFPARRSVNTGANR